MYSGWYIVIAILVSNFTWLILDFFDEFKKDKEGAVIKHYKENGLTWGNRKVLTYSETDISDWYMIEDDEGVPIIKCKKCNEEALYRKCSILDSNTLYAQHTSNYCPHCGAKMFDGEDKL